MKDPERAEDVRLAQTLALPEAEGLEEVARVLAATDLIFSDIVKVLRASAKACHTAANQGGRAVVAAILDVPPRSDLDAKIAQAVADLICPLPQRH